MTNLSQKLTVTLKIDLSNFQDDQIDEKEKDDKDASGNMIIESGQNIFNEGGNHISQGKKLKYIMMA
jgi:hypothetical protein